MKQRDIERVMAAAWESALRSDHPADTALLRVLLDVDPHQLYKTVNSVTPADDE